MQEFLTFTAKKRSIPYKSCIIEEFCNYRNKIGENDAFLHHFWIQSKIPSKILSTATAAGIPNLSAVFVYTESVCQKVYTKVKTSI